MLNQDAVNKLSKEDKKEFDKLNAEYDELWRDRIRMTDDLSRKRMDINSRIAQFCTEHKLIKG
ncbi:hypothetical protein [Lactococcus garvieae]|uniref:hypothetical protein n=1 Tax=Lactococcus garvieae TaxID=1363 RepID=UPI0022E0A4AD|nr:hypothetical protein [Lactococcus garvieae]